jgi:hypothetical protein
MHDQQSGLSVGRDELPTVEGNALRGLGGRKGVKTV